MSTIQKDKISIALCTRNGEAYLEEQLQSLEKQSLQPDELVISDDASSDSTINKIKHFSAKSNLNLRLIKNNEKLGVIENFSQAINNCQGNYLALCDQDDIWLPDRLKYSYCLIKQKEAEHGNGMPILMHSDLEIINRAGRKTASSFMKFRQIEHLDSKPLQRLLVQNFVTGSTVMFNRPLFNLALPIPPSAVMHDWWLALVAAACGNIIFKNSPTVLYRQHKYNYFGAKHPLSLSNIKRLAGNDALDKELAATIIQARELKERLKTFSPSNNSHVLDQYLAAVSRGGMAAAELAHKEKIGKSGKARNLLFLLVLLKKKYLRYIE